MGYDLKALKPKNKKESEFHMGAFSFPLILGMVGFLFPSYHGMDLKLCSWVMTMRTKDKRFLGTTYPPILSMDGFKVSDFEAKVMARCVNNYVSFQEDNWGEEKDIPSEFLKPIRDDFVEKFKNFAVWAEKSGGFEIC